MKILRRCKMFTVEQKQIYLSPSVRDYFDKLLKEDEQRQKYILDEKKRIERILKNINKNKIHVKTNYQVHPGTIGLILEDFVNFVCDYKGYKIGVGDYLIQKYLNERIFY